MNELDYKTIWKEIEGEIFDFKHSPKKGITMCKVKFGDYLGKSINQRNQKTPYFEYNGVIDWSDKLKELDKELPIEYAVLQFPKMLMRQIILEGKKTNFIQENQGFLIIKKKSSKGYNVKFLSEKHYEEWLGADSEEINKSFFEGGRENVKAEI